MILDRLQNYQRYLPLHPGFAEAFGFLIRTNFAVLTTGRHPIDGDRLFVILGRDQGRRSRARLEAHRRYIDIQLTLAGAERIGWRPLAACSRPEGAFDAQNDILFFADEPESWFAVPPETFAVFFPDDAHAPLAGEGELHKAVVKVAAEWP